MQTALIPEGLEAPSGQTVVPAPTSPSHSTMCKPIALAVELPVSLTADTLINSGNPSNVGLRRLEACFLYSYKSTVQG